MWLHAFLASVIIVGCNKSGAGGTASSNGSATKNGSDVIVVGAGSGSAKAPPADADVSRATTIMNAQLGALRNAQEAALVDTFTPDAVVLVPGPRLAHGETTGLRAAIARLTPHDTLKTATVTKLVAGSTPSAVWWAAEVDLVADSLESPDPTKTTIRVTELATAETGWKVVAGAFGEVTPPRMKSTPSSVDDSSATPPGPLTSLAADLAKLDASLASKATLLGTDKGEAAWDASASHALLAKWKQLSFANAGKPREVTHKDWTFAITGIDWQQPKKRVPARMSALVIAVPNPAGWQVVAVQFTAD